MAERARTVESAIQQGNNLARLFQQNTDAMLVGVDRMILLLRQKYEDDPNHFDLKGLLRQSISAENLTTLFAFTDESGKSTAITSDGTERKAYLGDRDYFVQLRDTAIDSLLISGPTAADTGRQTLILSRRLRHPDGSFAGVIGAAVDPGFIGDFYASIDIGARANVILRDFNGLILASAGTVVYTIGRQVMQPSFAQRWKNSQTVSYGAAVRSTACSVWSSIANPSISRSL